MVIRKGLILGIVLAASCAAVAAASTLKGTTSQQLPVTAKVAHGQVMSLVFAFRDPCNSGFVSSAHAEFHRPFAHPQRADGRMSDNFKNALSKTKAGHGPDGREDASFSARIQNGVVTGSLSAQVRYPKGILCRTGHVTFEAH